MASTSFTDPSFLSSMVVALGRGPSLALAERSSLSQVLTAGKTSRIPEATMWSVFGKVRNLDLCENLIFRIPQPVHLLVEGHVMPPVTDVIWQKELVSSRITDHLLRG